MQQQQEEERFWIGLNIQKTFEIPLFKKYFYPKNLQKK